MAKIDNLLSRAKEASSVEGALQVTSERTLVGSTDAAEVYQTSEHELPLYVSKSSSRDKLAAALLDSDVQLVQVSNGKPAVITHAKHGVLFGDFSSSVNAATKTLKGISFPVVTTVAKGDGGLVMSIEKLCEGTSIVDLINQGALSSEAAAFLWAAIEGKLKCCNFLVVGSSAEKMQVVSALSALIPVAERVAVVKSTAHSTHWVSIETPLAEAIEKAGEMKFDRIIGELETSGLSKKARQLFCLQGKLKGMLAMAGNNAGEAVQLLKQSGGKAVNALDVVIAVHSAGNSALEVVEIAELVNGNVKPLFIREKGKLTQVKLESELAKHAVYRGVSRSAVEAELAEKIDAINQWNKNGLRSNKEIRAAIRSQPR